MQLPNNNNKNWWQFAKTEGQSISHSLSLTHTLTGSERSLTGRLWPVFWGCHYLHFFQKYCSLPVLLILTANISPSHFFLPSLMILLLPLLPSQPFLGAFTTRSYPFHSHQPLPQNKYKWIIYYFKIWKNFFFHNLHFLLKNINKHRCLLRFHLIK